METLGISKRSETPPLHSTPIPYSNYFLISLLKKVFKIKLIIFKIK